MNKIYNLFFIATLIMLNSIFYLSVFEVSSTAFVLILSTTFIMLTMIIMANNSKNKYIKVLFFVVYILSLALLFVNKIYASFFNNYLPITMILKVNQISSVGDSIKTLLFSIPNTLFSIILIINICFLRKINFSLTFRKKIIATILVILLFFVMFISEIGNQNILVWSYNSLIVNDNEENNNTDSSNSIIKTIKNNNQYFGLAKNKNVIIIQLESFQNVFINKSYNNFEITPTLNKLIKSNSIYFNNYFQQIGVGNTADAEFITFNSLHPVISSSCYEKYTTNNYWGLPKILKDLGYGTYSFHGYEKNFWNRENAYIYQGFDKFYSEEFFNSSYNIGFGINDKDFFIQTADYISNLKKPFFSFIISLSSHFPFSYEYRDTAIELLEKDKGTTFGNYLLALNYTDNALNTFIEELKAKNLYEDSIIIIYGDHHGLNVSDVQVKERCSELLGKDYCYDDMMNVPLIIHSSSISKSQTIENLGSQMDFLPTILNLLGIEQKIVSFGRNILIEAEEYVPIQTYMVKGSFISKDYVFNMSRDGILNNSKCYERSTGSEVSLDKLENLDEILTNINSSLQQSKTILDNNLIEDLLSEKTITINNNIEPEFLVSHAGGRYNGISYLNCKEALINSKDLGYKFIEIDFCRTSDDKYVLIHDFDNHPEKILNAESKVYSEEEFLQLEMIHNLTQMTLEDLIAYIRENRDIFIITDIKDDNVAFMKYIKENYPDCIDNIIPQIYNFGEYIDAQKCGFTNIILTLYMFNASDEEIIEFVKNNPLLAVTMPVERVEGGLAKKLNEMNVFCYVHTINDINALEYYVEKGICGFYTDDISYNELYNQNEETTICAVG